MAAVELVKIRLSQSQYYLVARVCYLSPQLGMKLLPYVHLLLPEEETEQVILFSEQGP